MTKARLSFMLLVLVLTGVRVSAQCAIPIHSQLGITNQSFIHFVTSSVPSGVFNNAADIWAYGCGGYGSSFPELTSSASYETGAGVLNVDLEFLLGNSPQSVFRCGTSNVNIAPEGWITGGTITIWQYQFDGTDCQPHYDELLAHEMGHFLGLLDVDTITACNGTIMGSNPQAPDGDQCLQIDLNFETLVEEPDPDPDGTDIDGKEEGCGSNCSPMVLDLAGDGIATTGAENPVRFDIDADGTLELLGWTAPFSDDAFLWSDFDHDHRVTDGRELFGVGTVLPDGRRVSNGFEALKAFDDPHYGGNGDGRITSADAIWARLSLWVDTNHDGISDAQEVGPIQKFGVVELLLSYTIDSTPDIHGNLHLLKGTFLRRVADRSRLGVSLDPSEMTDVFFRVFGD